MLKIYKSSFEETFYLTHTSETQLATIFRPHNAYCIFVDSKALPLFKSAVKKLTDCYREQFPKAKIVYFDDAFPVFWADISLLRVIFGLCF